MAEDVYNIDSVNAEEIGIASLGIDDENIIDETGFNIHLISNKQLATIAQNILDNKQDEINESIENTISQSVGEPTDTKPEKNSMWASFNQNLASMEQKVDNTIDTIDNSVSSAVQNSMGETNSQNTTTIWGKFNVSEGKQDDTASNADDASRWAKFNYGENQKMKTFNEALGAYSDKYLLSADPDKNELDSDGFPNENAKKNGSMWKKFNYELGEKTDEYTDNDWTTDSAGNKTLKPASEANASMWKKVNHAVSKIKEADDNIGNVEARYDAIEAQADYCAQLLGSGTYVPTNDNTLAAYLFTVSEGNEIKKAIVYTDGQPFSVLSESECAELKKYEGTDIEVKTIQVPSSYNKLKPIFYFDTENGSCIGSYPQNAKRNLESNKYTQGDNTYDLVKIDKDIYYLSINLNNDSTIKSNIQELKDNVFGVSSEESISKVYEKDFFGSIDSRLLEIEKVLNYDSKYSAPQHFYAASAEDMVTYAPTFVRVGIYSALMTINQKHVIDMPAIPINEITQRADTVSGQIIYTRSGYKNTVAPSLSEYNDGKKNGGIYSKMSSDILKSVNYPFSYETTTPSGPSAFNGGNLWNGLKFNSKDWKVYTVRSFYMDNASDYANTGESWICPSRMEVDTENNTIYARFSNTLQGSGKWQGRALLDVVFVRKRLLPTTDPLFPFLYPEYHRYLCKYDPSQVNAEGINGTSKKFEDVWSKSNGKWVYNGRYANKEK